MDRDELVVNGVKSSSGKSEFLFIIGHKLSIEKEESCYRHKLVIHRQNNEKVSKKMKYYSPHPLRLI